MRAFTNVNRVCFRRIAATIAAALVTSASSALAQQPAAAPPPDPGLWEGTAGAGLAITSGNSDTSNLNFAFDVTRDPLARNVLKWTGLYIRGEQQDELVANRLSLGFRDQFALNGRSFVFGQIDYLRDTFKQIDYIVAPTVGLGYKVIDTPATRFAVDGGVGAIWEKNPELDVDTSAAVTAGEKLEHALTATSTLKHAFAALWKADDFEDGLYTISVGLGTKISEVFGLSVDVLDTYKNRPPTPDVKKNDVALVTAVTAKF